MTAGPAPPGARRFVAASLILLCALLPALVAGVGLDAPAARGEYSRVQQGLADVDPELPALRSTRVARLFYGMTAPAADGPAPPAGSAEAHELLARARLAQVLGILALSLLTYLSVTLARGRTRALLTCLLLAALPAVHLEGEVLRPETPAAIFGLLSLLLLQGMPGLRRPQPRGRSRALPVTVLSVAVATTTGLAITALPSYTIYLLVPGAVMGLATLVLGLRFLRVLRRRRFLILPVKAFNRRLLPWVLPAFASLVMTIGLLNIGLDEGVTTVAPTPSDAGLLPDAAWARWPMLALAGLGLVVLVIRVGLELGRAGRIGPELLLFVHGAVLVLHRLLGEGTDALPAAPATAYLLAEGLAAVVLIGGGLLMRKSPARP